MALNFTNPFINRNCEIVSYSVIVAEADSTDEKLNTEINETWYTAYRQHPSPPYAAIYKCEQLFETDRTCNSIYSTKGFRWKRSVSQSTATIVIGEDTSCDSAKIAHDIYCNGPLKQKTKYRIFIRAYNEESEFTDAKSAIIQTGRIFLLVYSSS